MQIMASRQTDILRDDCFWTGTYSFIIHSVNLALKCETASCDDQSVVHLHSILDLNSISTVYRNL